MKLSVGGRTSDAWVDAAHDEAMRTLWCGFGDAVGRADELISIGYSLPGTDAAAIETLKVFSSAGGTGRRQVLIVNRDPSVLERYSRVLGVEAIHAAEDFESFEPARPKGS
jgi:hypothetical protein